LSNPHTNDHEKTLILEAKYLLYQEIGLVHDLKLGSKPAAVGIAVS